VVTGLQSDLRLSSAGGRGLVAAAVLGSGMAMLDGTVVNVALPTIGRDLDAGLAALQWTVNAYTLTLAALILLGGSLGDRLGRRRVFVFGVVWFALASLGCALAPGAGWLVAARAVQGVGGALMTPGSLAMIQASIHPADRGRAIGTWSGLGGLAAVLGPFLGGWLIGVNWRLVFAINIPLAAVTVALALRFAPDTRDPEATGPLDLAGAVLGAVALGGATFALMGAPDGASPTVIVAAVVAVAGGLGFVAREHFAPAPMVPLSLFSNRTFTVVNLLTLAAYAALSGVFFLLVLQMQVSLGYTPLQAGLATLPSSALMILFSSRMGDLGQRIGPRLPLTVGPLLAAAGVLWLSRLQPGDGYLTAVLPGILLFGAGLTIMVAPLTATVMAAVPQHEVGVASGVNNAVARSAGLFAVAALPAVAGLSGRGYEDPALLTPAYATGLTICAVLLAVGALICALGLPRRAGVPGAEPVPATAEVPAERALVPAGARGVPDLPCVNPCAGPGQPPSMR
jgi:EmrB/QacA subfamily drug resistance transporter